MFLGFGIGVLINWVYIVGMISRVSIVDVSRFEMMVQVIGGYRVELENVRGSSLVIVVVVVSRIGWVCCFIVR